MATQDEVDEIRAMGHRIANAFPPPGGDGTFEPAIASYALAVSLVTIITDSMQRPFRDAFAAILLAAPPSEWCELLAAPDGSVFIAVPIFDPDNVPPIVKAQLVKRRHRARERHVPRRMRTVSRRAGRRV